MEQNMQNHESIDTQPDAQHPEERTQKRFTQADVDRIVKDRLSRQAEAKEKAHQETLDAMQSEITIRENKLACREYLLDMGYPAALLDIIDTSDPTEFKHKAYQVYTMFGRRKSMPLADTESLSRGDTHTHIQSAFSRGTRHKPKDFATPYEED